MFFLKSTSTITNVASYLDYTSLVACLQHHGDGICFDLSSSVDLVPFYIRNLSAYGLSHGYVSWVRYYITSSYFFVRIHRIYSIQSVQITNKCTAVFTMHFIHKIPTNMLRLHSGHTQSDILIYEYKNTNVVNRVGLTPKILIIIQL